MSEVRKCPKCGSTDFKQQKRVKLMDASWGFYSTLIAAAYICGNCGYIEFYLEK